MDINPEEEKQDVKQVLRCSVEASETLCTLWKCAYSIMQTFLRVIQEIDGEGLVFASFCLLIKVICKLFVLK